MSKASKRERQRQNREAARAARVRAEKRSKQRRLAIRVGIPVLLIVALLFWLSRSGNDNKKSASKATTTTAPAGSPPLTIDPNAKYTATIETSEGTMVADLDAKNAMWGANNFVTLARKGFYDGLGFHRAAKDFVIQGGDPKGDGSGGPGYEFVSEVPKNEYAVGDLAYAKAQSAPAGSAGSQFFVITSPNALTTFNKKPYQYGAFGHLTSGLDVAQKIESFAPASGDGPPTTDVKITKVTIAGPPPVTTTKAGATTTTTTAGSTTTASTTSQLTTTTKTP